MLENDSRGTVGFNRSVDYLYFGVDGIRAVAENNIV